MKWFFSLYGRCFAILRDARYESSPSGRAVSLIQKFDSYDSNSTHYSPVFDFNNKSFIKGARPEGSRRDRLEGASRKRRRLTISFSLLFNLLQPASLPPLPDIPPTEPNFHNTKQQTIPKSIKINVLLDEYNTNKIQQFSISSNEKLILKTKSKNNTYSSHILPTCSMDIVVKNNQLYGRSSKGPLKKLRFNPIHLQAKDHILTVNGKKYHGIISLQLDIKKKMVYLTNSLDLEDYVYAVLLSESYQSWPHEMQKIQAIVSRTYGIYQILQRKQREKHGKQPYDIKCNTFHQRYDGAHDYKHLREAVVETKNVILTYNDKVIITMFDACCGGSIPAYIKGIDFVKAPYLARLTPCHYCKNYSLYKWQRTIPIKTFVDNLYKYPAVGKRLHKHKKLTNISVTNKDKAGIVHKVLLEQGKHKTFVCGKDLWMSQSTRIRSKNFILKKEANNIIVKGRGFGHQLGLCQRGARELVRRDWSVQKILDFYYPNTALARLRAVYKET